MIDPQTISLHFLHMTLVVLLALIILLVVVVLIISFKKYDKLEQINAWKSLIDKKLAESIIYGENRLLEDEEFKIHLQVPAFRNLLIISILSSLNKFSGYAKKEIIAIYHSLKLEKDSLKKLENKRAYIIALGIQEISSMEVQGAFSHIEGLVSHKSIMVNHEAQFALVKLRGFEGLSFLKDLKTPLSDWHQLRLQKIIPYIPEDKEYLIKEWLENDNNSVKIFCMKLIRKFQLVNLYTEIQKFLNHEDLKVRYKAIKTMIALENATTIPEIMSTFSLQPENIQVEILTLIRFTRDPQIIDQLKGYLLNDSSSRIKVLVSKILFNLREQNYLQDVLLKHPKDSEISKIINYTLQEKSC